MRKLILIAAALAVSTPALAADAPSESAQEMQEMAAKMNDPAMQAAMAGGLNAMLGTLLDFRVDGFAKALEPLNGGKKIKMKGNTIREMAERKDRNFEQKLQGQTRAAVGGMGAMATALAAMMPQLEKAMDQMGDAMDKAKDRLPAAE